MVKFSGSGSKTHTCPPAPTARAKRRVWNPTFAPMSRTDIPSRQTRPNRPISAAPNTPNFQNQRARNRSRGLATIRWPLTDPEAIARYFDRQAPERDRWKRENRFYHEYIEKLCRFHIPPGSTVLEIGSGTGDLLNALAPSRGVGIDISPRMVEIASRKYPHLTFRVGNAEDLPLTEKFDYIVLSDVLGST